MDVPTRKIISYILVGKRSWGVTLSRDERTMFVANGFGDDITVIDVRTSLAQSFADITSPLAVAAAPRRR